MKHEEQLKLQAYLDGELSGRETRAVEELVARDAAAQNLLAELRFTKTALAGNEPEIKLPESREFYWSKIEREIQRLETVPATRGTNWFTWWWRRYWIPFSGFAVMMALLLGTVNQYLFRSPVLEEIDNPSEETGAFTFRSDKERMTVVWLYDRTEETASDLEDLEEDPVK
jgi:hypothetical protein